MDVTGAPQLPQQTAPQVAPPSLPATSDPIKARAAAESFEAFFIGQYLEQMFTGVEANSLFGGGNAENIYRSLMLQEIGKNIAANGGFGIADSVQQEILRIQEAQQQEQTQ